MRIFRIGRAGPGHLSTCPAPEGGEALHDEMRFLAAQGVTVLVSALTVGEVERLGLGREAALAAELGMRFVSLPVADRTILPASEAVAALDDLGRALADGEHVAIHCWYGIGRSSTLAAALMVTEGSTPDDAWAAITTARGHPVPDTQDQLEWVAALARTLAP